MYEQKPWLKFYNGSPETIDYPRVTMYEALMQTVEQFPDRIAYDFFDYTSTYRQFGQDIDICANALAALGMKKGDRITISMPTSPQGIICFYAANKLGIVASMIHPLSTPKEMIYYLNISQSRVALTLDLFYDRFKEIKGETSLETLILTEIFDQLTPREQGADKTHEDPIVKWWKPLMAASYPEAPKADMGTDELAVILYSGGTTGFPKGIMLSNYNFISEGLMVANWGGALSAEGASILAILPIFHGFGLGICCNAAFMGGAKSILVPQFTPEIVVDLIKKKKPTLIAGVPTLYDALTRNPDFQTADLSCLQNTSCGADSLPRQVKERFEEIVLRQGGNVQLVEGYGLTEAVTGIMSTPLGGYREGSVGIPFPDMLAKVVAIGTTEEVPIGQEGELCVSGPAVMLGYLEAPEETAAVIKKHEDGLIWLHTGDIFSMDQDGYFYFKLRLKRMIKSSGMNVYPVQVEAILDKHPDVQSACVIGVPDETQVQRVKAFCVLKDGSKATPEMEKALIEYCREHLIKWSCPREVEFRDSLPVTRVGKIAYTELEKQEIEKLRSEGKYTGGK
ncbi:MAG: Long-chain-fatty-acid--CoA ligase [Syntrophus sp. SKADARSKE-3]|nr:Long-chain-fatty-acid--CoA ligase [Syntrophus sp. SKADARSKE-3]